MKITNNYKFLLSITVIILLFLLFSVKLLNLNSYNEKISSVYSLDFNNKMYYDLKKIKFREFVGLGINNAEKFATFKNCQTTNVWLNSAYKLDDETTLIPFISNLSHSSNYYYLMIKRNFLFFGGCQHCHLGGVLISSNEHRQSGINLVSTKISYKKKILRFSKNEKFIIKLGVFVNGVEISSKQFYSNKKPILKLPEGYNFINQINKKSGILKIDIFNKCLSRNKINNEYLLLSSSKFIQNIR